MHNPIFRQKVPTGKELSQQTDIYTTPSKIEKPSTRLLTGNEYLALPEISPRSAGIISMNVILSGYYGLLEFAGSPREPLLQPFIRVNRETLELRGKMAWHYREHWVPRFSCRVNGLELHGSIYAPPGHAGAAFSLHITNTGSRPVDLEWGWRGCWYHTFYTVFNRRSLEENRELRHDPWTDSLILEARPGFPVAALAFSPPPGEGWKHRIKPYPGKENPSFCWQQKEWLLPGQNTRGSLFIGVNLEADGAGTTAVDLKRRGVEQLSRETIEWLNKKKVNLSEPQLNRTLNQNLFFTYFYSMGKAMDTQQPVLLTSRSPRYYVSAAFWSRDTLLWSFPAILIVEPSKAREILKTVFARHLERAGEHAHYINGCLLYPGFELDQLAAHYLALRHYLEETGDRTLLEETLINRGLQQLADKAETQYHADTGMYATFLDPSDDPVEPYPFLIYNNALLQQSFSFLAELQENGDWYSQENFSQKARELKEAIYRLGVTEGPYGAMFAWAVSREGKTIKYDNPPGSLQLLAHYRFCSYDDPVFVNTVNWVRSKYNPNFKTNTTLKEPGSDHAHNPWPLSAANDLLSLNLGKGEFFKKAPMDSGLCCETVNPETGKASTGLAFASAAGFVAYSLYQSFFRGER